MGTGLDREANIDRQADVSDQKLADIYAFIESLPSASPDTEDIPVLRALLEETPR